MDDDLVVTTGVNSATMGPGPARDALMANGRWREAHKPQERSIYAPAPTLDSKVGSAWQIHQPGQRGSGAHLSPQEAAMLQSYPTHLSRGPATGLVALDDFAGTGWGVACQWLGIEEGGVELMDEAVATREAAGMATIGRDVWDHLAECLERPWRYDLYIASPPCQTFSMAGKGAGRRALDEVLALIDTKAYRDVEALREFGERHDPRTALVLVPLVRAYRDLPRYIVLEQVPTVLPVWERIAEELRAWGYSVWVGKLYAEQYGVPQTRIRAVLIAKRDPELDGEAAPPTPTHSRYYARDPQRLDPGVEKWVSMAEALGWDIQPGEVLTRSSFSTPKRGTGGGHHAFDPARSPAHTVTSVTGSWKTDDFEKIAEETQYFMRSNYGTGGDPAARGERPATTVAADDRIAGPGRSEFVKGGVSRQNRAGSTRVTIAEAAALQSYPRELTFAGTKGKQFLQVGNAVPPLLARAILAKVIER